MCFLFWQLGVRVVGQAWGQFGVGMCLKRIGNPKPENPVFSNLGFRVGPKRSKFGSGSVICVLLAGLGLRV